MLYHCCTAVHYMQLFKHLLACELYKQKPHKRLQSYSQLDIFIESLFPIKLVANKWEILSHYSWGQEGWAHVAWLQHFQRVNVRFWTWSWLTRAWWGCTETGGACLGLNCHHCSALTHGLVFPSTSEPRHSIRMQSDSPKPSKHTESKWLQLDLFPAVFPFILFWKIHLPPLFLVNHGSPWEFPLESLWPLVGNICFSCRSSLTVHTIHTLPLLFCFLVACRWALWWGLTDEVWCCRTGGCAVM